MGFGLVLWGFGCVFLGGLFGLLGVFLAFVGWDVLVGFVFELFIGEGVDWVLVLGGFCLVLLVWGFLMEKKFQLTFIFWSCIKKKKCSVPSE